MDLKEPDPIQIGGLYRKIASGSRERHALISSKQMQNKSNQKDKPYSLTRNKSGELLLSIFQLGLFMDQRKTGALINHIKTQTSTRKHIHLAEANIANQIARALKSELLFGINAPLVLYVGYDSIIRDAQKQASIDDPDYSGKGLLKVNFSDKMMTASITNFDVSSYSNPDLKLTRQWIEREAKRLGLIPPSESLIDPILLKIKSKQNLDGSILANGIPSTMPEGPTLSPIQPQEASTNSNKIRSKSAGVFVRAGEIAAHITFENEGTSGVNVLGEPLSIPLPTSSLEVEIGPGIKVEKGQYFALLDGFLKIDGHKIEVLEAYVHEGDINLTSGDIQFKGNIVINGSVDTGSTIVSSKDIIINGDVRDGFVHCGGNLTVAGHIITGKKVKFSATEILRLNLLKIQTSSQGSIYAQKSILSISVCKERHHLSGQKTKLANRT